MSFKQLLHLKGVTQTRLCAALHLSRGQMSLLVSGKRRMPLEYAAIIAREINVPIEMIHNVLREGE